MRKDIDLERFKHLLLQQQSRVTGGIESIKEKTFSTTQQESTSEDSTYDQHSADLALDTFEREKDLGLLDGLRIDRTKVNLALRRLEQGTYGYCTNCGKPIPVERLELVPEAELCMPCQRAQEVAPPAERPVEEQVANTYMHGIETITDDVISTGRKGPREVGRKPVDRR